MCLFFFLNTLLFSLTFLFSFNMSSAFACEPFRSRRCATATAVRPEESNILGMAPSRSNILTSLRAQNPFKTLSKASENV